MCTLIINISLNVKLLDASNINRMGLGVGPRMFSKHSGRVLVDCTKNMCKFRSNYIVFKISYEAQCIKIRNRTTVLCYGILMKTLSFDPAITDTGVRKPNNSISEARVRFL